MSRRLYLGKLPPDVRQEELTKFFDGFGRIVDCRVMTGFGFVEFESSRDAEEVVTQFNGKSFMGSPIVVEFAKEGRSRPREPYEDRHGRAPPRTRRPPGVRLIVSGISRDTSWQDLKDFGREAGSVSFADIDRDVPGQGILEYINRDDADSAIKTLDGKDLRGQSVRVALAEERDYRRDDRYREDRFDRGERFNRDGPRRDRSRSPYRREDRERYDERRYDDRRRSPPRRDDDRRHDDRRDNRRDRDDDRGDRRNGGDWHRGGRSRQHPSATTTERAPEVVA